MKYRCTPAVLESFVAFQGGEGEKACPDKPVDDGRGSAMLSVIASVAKQSSLCYTIDFWIATPLRGSQ